MTLDRLVDEIEKCVKREPSSIPIRIPYSVMGKYEAACKTDATVHASIIHNEIKQMIQQYVEQEIHAHVAAALA